MEQKYVYLLVIDGTYDGDTEQSSSVYASLEDAKAVYDELVKNFKTEDRPECFDEEGNFNEEEYEDEYSCDEFVEGNNGESFSFYEAGNYNNWHYDVYYRKMEVLE